MNPLNLSYGSVEGKTEFRKDDNNVSPSKVCGFDLKGRSGACAVVQVDGQTYRENEIAFESSDASDNEISMSFAVGETGLLLFSRWVVCPKTGIVSRTDRLENHSQLSVIVTRCQASYTFLSDEYEYYAQASRWCRENQGSWQKLLTGICLSHAAGRTSEGATPYIVLRSRNGKNGIGFHVLPSGNWIIVLTPVTDGGRPPYLRVELGLSGAELFHELTPGSIIECPEILIQPVPRAIPRLGAPLLHSYIRSRLPVKTTPIAPIVYNTWFYEFDVLDVPRLRTQLKAAAEIGCEVFVIDAGWYGAGGPDWSAQTGDWREKTEAAFRGRMSEFADEVRQAGLGFGLWMEPERFGAAVPVREEHPGWFVPVGALARIDLEQAEAYAWLKGEILRLVEVYGLAWMKIDFNFSLGTDRRGKELSGYYSAWYSMMEEIRLLCPGTFFEGCASGGLRADLLSQARFDGHFLSDTVNPVDTIRIFQGACLRLAPGRTNLWAVVRSAGSAVPRYGSSTEDSHETVLVPQGAVWEPAETANLDFPLIVAMLGMMGLSGDLAGFSDSGRARIRQILEFYKSWRAHIAGAVVYLLTDPEPVNRRTGWAAFQYVDPDSDKSLLFVYRLAAAGEEPVWNPVGLAADRNYVVRRCFDVEAGRDESGNVIRMTGLQLAIEGVKTGLDPIATKDPRSATVISIEPEEALS